MPTSTAVPYVTRGGIDFPKPSPRDKAKILHRLRAERRDKLAANLKATGIAPEQQFAELESFDNEGPYGEEQFLKYLGSAEGQEDILLSLLRKTSSADAEAKLDSFTEPAFPLLCELFGYTLKEKTEGGADPAANPPANPTGNPLAYDRPTNQAAA